tara:strand:+ start:696 stop:1280 length:585 start_codon:yes stop_codon:yes gene_type:complete
MIFENYYCTFDNPFSENFIAEIKKEGLATKQQKASIGVLDKKKNTKIRKSKISWIKNPLVYDHTNPYIHKANLLSKWNFQWDWNEAPQFTQYGKHDFYNWHVDGHTDSYGEGPHKGKMRKLSSILLLSEPGKDFEGGEFEIDFDSCGGKGKKIVTELKKGTFIVFPSFVKHRVKPVTKGIRHSMVLWHLGFPWK